MSTLKTNNIEHLDATSPSIEVNAAGGIQVGGALTATTGTFSGNVSVAGVHVATGATISGSTNEVIVNTADASSTTLRLRSDGGGTNGGHLEGEGLRISFDAKRGNDGGNGSASYIQQKAIGDLGASYPVDLAFGVRRFSAPFEALRIASTGNIGIGTDNPTRDLQISKNADCAIRIDANNSNVNARTWEIVVGGNATNNAEMVFRTRQDDGTGGSECARITRSGSIKLPSGGGIDFSATADGSGTDTSELLDDFEEGYWTPTVDRGSNPGSTLSVTRARYIKVGRKVTIWCELIFEGGDSGSFRLTSLPYNADTTGTGSGQSGAGMSAVGSVMFNNLNASTITSITAYLWSNLIYFYYTPGTDGAGWNEVTGAQVGGNTSGANLIFTVTYFTA